MVYYGVTHKIWTVSALCINGRLEKRPVKRSYLTFPFENDCGLRNLVFTALPLKSISVCDQNILLVRGISIIMSKNMKCLNIEC